MNIKEGIREINGAQLYYKIMGQGQPIVMLHGGPGISHEYFLPHMERLAQGHKLIFYDQRASGNSSKAVAPDTISPQSFVEDLEGMRQAFKLQQINLLGHSWGGLLALYYALTYPKSCGFLVLVDSAPANSQLDALNVKRREERLTPQDLMEMQKLTQSEAFQRRELGPLMEYLRISESVKFYNRELINELRFTLDAEKLEKLMWVGQLMDKYLSDYDIHSQLAAIERPTLILHGEYDTIPLEAAQRIQQQIKGSKLIALENCGHFPFIEAKGTFFKVVNDFIASQLN